MSKLKIGDKVTLSISSDFYDPSGEDEFNPFGVTGTVTEVARGETLEYLVDWSSISSGPLGQKIENSYNREDLVRVLS